MKRWIPFWVIPVLLFFAVGTVWLRLQIVKSSYEIDQLTQSVQNLRKERENLEVQLARIRSPHHLKKLAETKFNLRPATVDQVVYVEKGRP